MRHRQGLRLLLVCVLVLLVAAAGFAAVALTGSRDGGSRDEEVGRHSPSARPSVTPTRSPGASGWNPSPASVAAVGDSITRGFDACGLLADCPGVSWATGDSPRVRSLAGRLLDEPAGHSWNLAVSGSRMAGLDGQMRRAAARGPELVTVMTGANDACRPRVDAMTPVHEFRAGFRRALHTLREKRPEAQVYVSSVPDLRRLWSVGRTSPRAVRAWEFGLCPSMLRSPRSTAPADEQRREQVYTRVTEYNRALREECTRFGPRCRDDEGAVFRHRFTAADLSEWDWFHPGPVGQRTLAKLAHHHIARGGR